MAEDKEDQGFTINDKRHFTPAGEVRKDDAGERERVPVPGAGKIPSAEEPLPGTAPQIDFPSYIFTYYTQGLVLLGEVPNPYTNKNDENLEAAKHTIDILAMLQEKTRGNLTPEEDHLLDDVLYQLRMKFMAKTNRIKL